MKKYITVGLVVLVIGLVIGFVLHQAPKVGGATSSSGAYTNSSGLWTVAINPTTATTTSITNSGATDRAITGTIAYCSGIGTSFSGTVGAGIANWTLQVSTGTAAVTGASLSNTNYVFNATLSTSSAFFSVASTSPGGGIGDVTRVWPQGTLLNFLFNATNTASCTVGVTGYAL